MKITRPKTRFITTLTLILMATIVTIPTWLLIGIVIIVPTLMTTGTTNIIIISRIIRPRMRMVAALPIVWSIGSIIGSIDRTRAVILVIKLTLIIGSYSIGTIID